MEIENELRKYQRKEMFYELLEECYDMSHRYRKQNIVLNNENID